MMGLLTGRNVERTGSVRFEGQEMLDLTPKQMRHIWGQEMSMIFQDPMTSLNPLMKIGKQITEPLQRPPRARAAATPGRPPSGCCATCASPRPRRRLDQYPHELSGGMRQRVMIAIALACGPTLLFADEPTTALDVTVQSQILDLIAEQRRERNMSLVLVTHDLGVVAGRTDEIAVMYGGRIVEKAPTRTLFANMKMPYTEALMASIPKLEDPSHSRLRTIPGRPPDLVNPPQGCRFAPRCAYVRDRCRAEEPPLVPADDPRPRVRLLVPGRLAGVPRAPRPPRRRIDHRRRRRRRRAGVLMAGTGKAHLRDGDDIVLRVEDLVVEFPVGRTGLVVNAVSGISLDVRRGETLGLVGESGCGKSTTGRAIMQLPRPTSGSVTFEGQDMTKLSPEGHARGADAHADDLPGPDLVAEPAAQGARRRDGAADDLEAGVEPRSAARSSTGRSRRSASIRRGPPRARPTSSPAGSASASRSPARWCSTRA